MQAISKPLLMQQRRHLANVLLQHNLRTFGVTFSEIHHIEKKLRHKLNMMKMHSQDSEFKYEPPEMIYDKKTGDVKILPKKIKKKGTIIQSNNDLERERAALYEELGVPQGDLENEDYSTPENMAEVAKKVYAAQKTIEDDFDFDPASFNVFSRDFFRVDCGLMIMRVPIFLHMRDPDIEMLKLRSKLMNEYWCDFRKYIPEFNEVSQLNESYLNENPYASDMNLDNYPTHEWTDPETGETHSYCAASKNFRKVDPHCSDFRSLHYAPEDRTYFLVRNKYTQEW